MSTSRWCSRKLLVSGMAAAALLGCSQAFALCSITDPVQPGNRPAFYFSVPAHMAVPSSDIKVGQVLTQSPPMSMGMTGGAGGFSMNMTVSCNTASGTYPSAYVGVRRSDGAQAVGGVGDADIFAIPGTPLGFRLRSFSGTLKQSGIANGNNSVVFDSGTSQRMIPSGVDASTWLEIIVLKDINDPAWQEPFDVPGGVLAHITDLVLEANHHFYDIYINPINVFVWPCITQDVTVDLGSHSISDLPGLHDTSPAVPFAIPLRNCPSGFNRISYVLEPTTAFADGLSAVQLDPSSEASGVSVQLLQENGTPHPLNREVPFNQPISAGGNFDIPLQARFINMDPRQAKPGRATANVRFSIIYE